MRVAAHTATLSNVEGGGGAGRGVVLFYPGQGALARPGSSAGQRNTMPIVLLTRIQIVLIKCGVGRDDMTVKCKCHRDSDSATAPG